MNKISTLIIASVFLMALSIGCTKKDNQLPAGDAPTLITPPGAGGELKIEDTVVGKGIVAAPGKTVTVHYTGWLQSGQKFDSSLDRNEPFKFQLGAGQVIAGWDKGVSGMKIGGKRKLTIPPNLGYGERGAGDKIPGNSTLVFDVELLNVQ